jgi:hypothetical protein
MGLAPAAGGAGARGRAQQPPAESSAGRGVAVGAAGVDRVQRSRARAFAERAGVPRLSRRRFATCCASSAVPRPRGRFWARSQNTAPLYFQLGESMLFILERDHLGLSLRSSLVVR